MTPRFSHNVTNSFFLWFDNYIMRKASAFKNYSTAFYNYSDTRLGGSKVVYGSPYKQWVYDHNISSATIPSGVYVNGSFMTTGTSGMMIDYDNGRLIFNSGVPTNLNISGSYSVKEFNTYLTNQSEYYMVVEGKYIANSRFTVNETYVPPYNDVTPAVFVTMENFENRPFALGGEDETRFMAKALVFAENAYQLDGILGVFSDSFNETFNIIPMNQHPLGEFMNLKTSLYPTGYDYSVVSNANSAAKCYIYKVTTAKMRDDYSKEINPNLYIGFIDFDIGNIRYPRL